MTVIKSLVLAFLLLIVGSVYCQSPNQWAKHGKAAMDEGDLYGAIEYYSKAYRADTTRIENLMALANAYRMNNNYQMAELNYEEVYSRPTRTLYGESAYWLARMQQSQGKYALAAKNFERYANYEAENGSYLWKDARQQIKACEWAESSMKDSLEIQFMSTRFASNYADFGGTLINDSTLLYSSLQFVKKDSTLKLAKKERNKKVQVIGGTLRDFNWVRNEDYDTILANPSFHVGNATYFVDSNWLIYSECADYANCKLKYRRWNGKTWDDAIEFPNTINLEGFSATQPHMAIVKGKPTLFFVSNRPQGRGNLDIWYSTFEKRLNGFKYPRNMGRKVNTPGNEITPFYSSDSNALYFSSDWWEGYGGFDVHKVEVTSLRSTSKAENLSLPINTSSNDLYYWTQNSFAFVSSNRPGGAKMEGQTCCNDIYFAGVQPPPEPLPVIDTVVPKDTAPDTIVNTPAPSKLADYLPVLYFDNDQPNPRSYSRSTKANYADLFLNYQKQQTIYKQELMADSSSSAILSAVDSIFEKKINRGFKELQLFLEALATELDSGKKITVTIKGYASPLAASQYNLNLSERRIASVVNYFKSFEDKKLTTYLNNGQLNIERAPFGETEAKTSVSDSRTNKAQSVYSPAAMLERRIEVIKVVEE